MIYAAIDPGETIGFAYCETGVALMPKFTVMQSKDLESIRGELSDLSFGLLPGDYHLVIESYNSSGILTKEAYTTIDRMAYFHGYAQCDGWQVVRKAPQWRKSHLSLAEKMAEEFDFPGPHGVDALAHLLKLVGYPPLKDEDEV